MQPRMLALTLRKRVFGGFAAVLALLIVLAVVMQRGAGSVRVGAEQVRNGSNAAEHRHRNRVARRATPRCARCNSPCRPMPLTRRRRRTAWRGWTRRSARPMTTGSTAPVARYRAGGRCRHCGGGDASRGSGAMAAGRHRRPHHHHGDQPVAGARDGPRHDPCRHASGGRRSRPAMPPDRASSRRAIRPTRTPRARRCRPSASSVDRMAGLAAGQSPRAAPACRSGGPAGALHRRTAGGGGRAKSNCGWHRWRATAPPRRCSRLPRRCARRPRPRNTRRSTRWSRPAVPSAGSACSRSLGAIGLGLVLAWLIGRAIARPVRQLTERHAGAGRRRAGHRGSARRPAR